MIKYKVSICFILLIYIIIPSFNNILAQSEPPIWNKNWNYYQKLSLPIDAIISLEPG